MRCAAGHFLDVAKAINKSGHVARAHLWIAYTEPALAVASHGVHVATIGLYKDGVLLSAANIGDHDVETAHLR